MKWALDKVGVATMPLRNTILEKHGIETGRMSAYLFLGSTIKTCLHRVYLLVVRRFITSVRKSYNSS